MGFHIFWGSPNSWMVCIFCNRKCHESGMITRATPIIMETPIEIWSMHIQLLWCWFSWKWHELGTCNFFRNKKISVHGQVDSSRSGSFCCCRTAETRWIGAMKEWSYNGESCRGYTTIFWCCPKIGLPPRKNPEKSSFHLRFGFSLNI